MSLTLVTNTDSFPKLIDKVNRTIESVNTLSTSNDVIELTGPVLENSILQYDGSNFVNVISPEFDGVVTVNDDIILTGNLDVTGNVDVVGYVDIDGGLNISTGNSFNINSTSVLSSTTLGSSVVSSSLTSLGTVVTGTWNATAIGVVYGGTGITSYTVGDLLYATGATTLAKLSIGSAAQVLRVNGTGNGFEWATITASAAGSDTYVQFNDGGSSFGGDAGLTYNKTTDILTIDGGLVVDTDVLFVDGVNNRVGIRTAVPSVALQVSGAALFTSVDIANGQSYAINGVSMLSQTTLGASVVGSSLTSVGTVTSGTWNATIVAGQYGGTGVANTGKTITVSGNTVIGSSTHTVTFSTVGNTSITLPTSGALAGVGGSDTQVIFNDGGSAFGGDGGLTYNKTTDVLSIVGGLAVDTNILFVDGSTDRVGMGTSSPNANFRLHVVGGQYVSTGLNVGSSTAIGTTGEIRATNNITAFYSSDIRLKENIVKIDSPLDIIDRINGVRFDWSNNYIKEHGGEDGYFVRKQDVGVIAQEVLKVLPEIVAQQENGYLAVKYDRLVPLLIECIKELKSRIEVLEIPKEVYK